MSEPSFAGFKPFVLDGSYPNLEPVRDEIFLDLGDGTGTEFLASTCYGQAVEECLRVGGDRFVLKVRPDMRALLFSQLRENYVASRVYHFAGQPESRLVPTGDLFVRFSSGANREQKLLAVRECFSDLEEEEDLRDGAYRLVGNFSTDPIVASKAIDFNPAIRQVAPVMMAIPSPTREGAKENLLAKR